MTEGHARKVGTLSSEAHGRSQTLVSIVINNYNYQDFVGRAIESALSQDWVRTEVIVVDDGSTDGSRAIIGQYSAELNIICKPNGGQASALNAGFAASRGDYVVFLDSDDILLPDAVSSCMALVGPNVAKVQYRLAIVDANDWTSGSLVPPPGVRMPDQSSVLATILASGRYVSPPMTGNLFSRASLVAMGPVPEQEFRINADTFLVFSAPFFGEIISVDRVLGHYRTHMANQWKGGGTASLRYGAAGVKLALQRHELVHRRARDRGWETPDYSTTDKNFAVCRLVSRKLSPNDHPICEEAGLMYLTYRAARLTLRERESFQRRLVTVSWIILIAALPRSMAARVAELLLVPGSRPQCVQALLRPLRQRGRRYREISI